MKLKANLDFFNLKFPPRSDVLLALWRRHNWLRSKIDKKQTQITPALKYRVYMVTVECQISKAVNNCVFQTINSLSYGAVRLTLNFHPIVKLMPFHHPAKEI